MSGVSSKTEEKAAKSPTNVIQIQASSATTNYDDLYNDASPDMQPTNSRKESHRASERKRRERLSTSMSVLDSIVRSTRKFANRKNVKLDKNSVIEHAIAYIKELQQVNEMYEKRLEEAMTQIKTLNAMLTAYSCNMGPAPILSREVQAPNSAVYYNQPLASYPFPMANPVNGYRSEALPMPVTFPMPVSVQPANLPVSAPSFDALVRAATETLAKNE